MVVWVVRAEVVRGYVVRVGFSSGETFDVDLASALDGAVLGPLRDESLFRQLRVDPELDTIVWPNGADLAPEFLLELGKAQRAGTPAA